MAKYQIRPGYCLHLPNNTFANPGEEVDLSGDLELEVLKNQGWKVEPVVKEIPLPEPEKKAPKGPPKDRAVKPTEVETR
jgi:hypothetical protein